MLRLAQPLIRQIGEARLERPVATVERMVKAALFDCRMCGKCVLSETGMSCPMNCPKSVRNGPCGGVRADGGCEVLPSMRCVWLDAYDGAARIPGGRRALETVQWAADHHRLGRSSWLAYLHEAAQTAPQSGPAALADHDGGTGPSSELPRVETPIVCTDRTAPKAVDSISERSGSRLERRLRAGEFAITAELNPPDSADPLDVLRAAEPLRDHVDAINATDASGANCHMSSMGIAALLTREGLDVVLQISCRDRNRIAIQGDVLGAAAMGVRNVLCLTGDGTDVGDQPGARPVFDLDSVSLLKTIRTMRDERRLLSGRALSVGPAMLLGAAENPSVPPFDERVTRVARKIAAGADFIQTNYVFDIVAFRRFMTRVCDHGLDQRVWILAGVGPLPSARTARWLRARIPGIHIPEPLIKRVEQATDPGETGKQICIELIQQIRETPGVAGIHLMAYRREHLIGEIISASGLRARTDRTLRHPECPLEPEPIE